MSSHDCTIEGTLTFQENISADLVMAAIKPFADHYGITTDEIEFDFAEDGFVAGVWINLQFFGYGGYSNEAVDQMVSGLSKIVSEGCTLTMYDHDTGDMEAKETTYFVGSEKQQAVARVKHGVGLLEEYAASVFGVEKMKEISDYINREMEKLGQPS